MKKKIISNLVALLALILLVMLATAQANNDFCFSDCASEQGICIANCNSDGNCIANCMSAYGRCVSRCH